MKSLEKTNLQLRTEAECAGLGRTGEQLSGGKDLSKGLEVDLPEWALQESPPSLPMHLGVRTALPSCYAHMPPRSLAARLERAENGQQVI